MSELIEYFKRQAIKKAKKNVEADATAEEKLAATFEVLEDNARRSINDDWKFHYGVAAGQLSLEDFASDQQKKDVPAVRRGMRVGGTLRPKR